MNDTSLDTGAFDFVSLPNSIVVILVGHLRIFQVPHAIQYAL